MATTIDRILNDTLGTAERAALIGALGGAAKGALVGLVIGKLTVGVLLGAAAGAGTALILRAAARPLQPTPAP